MLIKTQQPRPIKGSLPAPKENSIAALKLSIQAEE